MQKADTHRNQKWYVPHMSLLLWQTWSGNEAVYKAVRYVGRPKIGLWQFYLGIIICL